MAKFENSGLDSEGRVVLRIPKEDANKYLAAPEMYEALKAMYPFWVVRPDDEINALIYKMASEALAKTEGKSPSEEVK